MDLTYISCQITGQYHFTQALSGCFPSLLREIFPAEIWKILRRKVALGKAVKCIDVIWTSPRLWLASVDVIALWSLIQHGRHEFVECSSEIMPYAIGSSLPLPTFYVHISRSTPFYDAKDGEWRKTLQKLCQQEHWCLIKILYRPRVRHFLVFLRKGEPLSLKVDLMCIAHLSFST